MGDGQSHRAGLRPVLFSISGPLTQKGELPMPGLPDLEKKVAELEDDIKTLRITVQQLTSDSLKSGDSVRISSFDPTNGQDRAQCLTYIDTGRPPNIQACNAPYAQGWKLTK
jgi:hypothetical protein